MAPVTGKVTLEGQPVTAGNVAYLPVSKTDITGTTALSSGTIDASGNYTIQTGGKAGAPIGKYKVTVNPSMMPTGGKGGPSTPFNKMYQSDRSTPLNVEVVASPTPGQYDLKLKK